MSDLIHVRHVVPLRNWSAAQFGDWLRRGLTDYARPGFKPALFEPLHDLIVPNESIVEQLNDVYQLLNETARDAFAEGIGIAARDVERSTVGVAVFRILLDLAGWINTLRPWFDLSTKLNDEAFIGCVGDDEAERLFALALNVAAGAAPANGAANSIQELITSSRFKPQYYPIAWDALVRASPEALAKHSTLIRKPVEASGIDVNHFKSSVLTQVPLSTVQRQLPDLHQAWPLLAKRILDALDVDVDQDNDVVLSFNDKVRGPVVAIAEQLTHNSLNFVIELRRRYASRNITWTLFRRQRQPEESEGQSNPTADIDAPGALVEIASLASRRLEEQDMADG